MSQFFASGGPSIAASASASGLIIMHPNIGLPWNSFTDSLFYSSYSNININLFMDLIQSPNNDNSYNNDNTFNITSLYNYFILLSLININHC